MNFKKLWPVKADSISTVKDTQTHELDLEIDATASIRLGLVIFVVGFIGFILWATLVPLSSGVPTHGALVLDGRRKVVDHPTGGVLKKIMVKEGDRVEVGQILFKLDDTNARAAHSTIEAQLRAAELQRNFLAYQVKELKEMADEGYYPRNRLMDMERQLNDTTTQVIGLKDRLAAAALELDRTNLKAPSAGTVMGLSFYTEGGAIAPGNRLAEVVPDSDEMIIETQIQPNLIDKIVPGLPAEVRFSALNLRKTPIIDGEVMTISGDRFLSNQPDPRNPDGFYKAQIKVSASELKKLGDQVLKPGMPAEVIIKSGERTFFSYLFKPLTDQFARSFKER